MQKDFQKYFNLRFSSVPRPIVKIKSRYPGAANIPDEYGDLPQKKRKVRVVANDLSLYLNDTRQTEKQRLPP
jgi:hypothetical protein